MPKEKCEMMPTINSLKNTNGQKYMKKYTNSLENKCIKIKAMKKICLSNTVSDYKE